MIGLMLEHAGYQVDTAAQGQEGFRMASTGKYDLVTMDLMMPGWNGFEAIGSLELVSPHTRILVISAHVEEDEQERLKGYANVRSILRKPFASDALLAQVQEALGK